MQVTYTKFCKTIANDYGIVLEREIITKYNEFPIVSGRRKIRAPQDAIIVDRDGNEFVYMLSYDPAVRNDSMLVDFDYIYVIRSKGLDQIVKEAGIELRSEKCKICEGGGWYSVGRRYYYNDIYCDV